MVMAASLVDAWEAGALPAQAEDARVSLKAHSEPEEVGSAGVDSVDLVALVQAVGSAKAKGAGAKAAALVGTLAGADLALVRTRLVATTSETWLR